MPRGYLPICIRGCAWNVFGSQISLESHFSGYKICIMNFSFFEGKNFQQLPFFGVQSGNASKLVLCRQIYD